MNAVQSESHTIKSATPLQKILFFILMGGCLLPESSPPLALVLGLFAALTIGHPYRAQNSKWTKTLLQVSVVGLGFGMNLERVLEAGSTGILLTLATIIGTLLAGWAIGRWLGIESKISHLIASGTAICGGSAIAAVGPVLGANEREMSVSLGTVFILNSIALVVFPSIGQALAMSQQDFGLWAAIAIHDTSSVVGAAAKYGNEALQIATTVKLARALWIVPLTLVTAMLFRQENGAQKAKAAFPTFILLFLVASVLQTYVPMLASVCPLLVEAAKGGLKVTLFLIGAGLSLATLKSVGIKPMVQGVLLWFLISVVSLLMILYL